MQASFFNGKGRQRREDLTVSRGKANTEERATFLGSPKPNTSNKERGKVDVSLSVLVSELDQSKFNTKFESKKASPPFVQTYASEFKLQAQ